MKTPNAEVLHLYLSTGQKENPRKEVKTLEVDPQGVVGDKFYAKDPSRAVLLASTYSYDLAKANDIKLDVGLLGENIVLNLNPCGLLPGDKIVIGSVTFEVTQNCTLCKGLSNIDAKLPKLLQKDRGIFVRALSHGKIKVGDSVEFIQSSK